MNTQDRTGGESSAKRRRGAEEGRGEGREM